MALQTKTYSSGDYAYQSPSNGYVISLTLAEESIDAASNTSLVSYLFTISNTNNNRFYLEDFDWSISIGGQSIPVNNFTFDLSKNYTTQTIASGQITVTHNSDGTFDMPFNVGIPSNLQDWSKYAPPAMNIVDTMTLTTIVVTPPTPATLFMFNGQTVTACNFNGQAVNSLVFNGNKVY